MFRYSSLRSRDIRLFATHATKIPQTLIEKVVQKYAVGLPTGKVVKAGDYVMIRPEHVMTHDNTGPVISKYVLVPDGGGTCLLTEGAACRDGKLGSTDSVLRKCTVQDSPFSP